MAIGLNSDGGGGMAGAAEQLTHFQQQLWTPPKLKVDRREAHAILRLSTTIEQRRLFYTITHTFNRIQHQHKVAVL
jgi:hypothetical protein